MQQRLSTKEEYSKRINIVVEYINNHLTEEIRLETLADISNFSLYHFHRIMRAALGEPVGAFITRMRVETAARLLRYSDMQVQDIAYHVGYAGSSYVHSWTDLLTKGNRQGGRSKSINYQRVHLYLYLRNLDELPI